MPQPNPKNDSCDTSKIGEPAVEYSAPELDDNILEFPDWPDVPLPEYSVEEAFLLSLQHAQALLPVTGIQPWRDRVKTMNPDRFVL